jgi:hypothetical protein
VLIWQRAVELAAPFHRREALSTVLAALRAAHHDPISLSYAVEIGRRDQRARPGDSRVRAGLSVLEAALAFLGVVPPTT